MKVYTDKPSCKPGCFCNCFTHRIFHSSIEEEKSSIILPFHFVKNLSTFIITKPGIRLKHSDLDKNSELS